MNYREVEDYILSMADAKCDYSFGKEVAVFTIADKMFALLAVDKTPVRVSLRCEPRLAKVLRERYDEVMPGQKLNKKTWNTIVLTGQLNDEEIKDLIRHSYIMAHEATS
jgi:predicted DNA-binding protein (MmcQ/YjbR family)